MANHLLLIVREIPLRSPTKNILKSLADFANNDTLCTIPGYKTLQKDTGYCRQTVIKHVKELVALGFINKNERWINGRKSSNSYTWNIIVLLNAIPDTEKRGKLAQQYSMHVERLNGKVIKLDPGVSSFRPP